MDYDSSTAVMAQHSSVEEATRIRVNTFCPTIAPWDSIGKCNYVIYHLTILPIMLSVARTQHLRAV